MSTLLSYDSMEKHAESHALVMSHDFSGKNYDPSPKTTHAHFWGGPARRPRG